jgi:hypothetical protein
MVLVGLEESYMERFANNASDTLAGSITDAATSLTVHSSALFPAIGTTGNGWFRVLIDSEIVMVFSVSGETWSIERGHEGTTPAAHADNAVVTQIVTAHTMGAPVMDWLYPRTYGVYYARLNAADYAWVNQGGAFDSDASDCLGIEGVSGAGVNLRMRVRSMTFTDGLRIIALVTPVVPTAKTGTLAGICLRQSSDGKVILFGIDANNMLVIKKYTDASTFSADYTLGYPLATASIADPIALGIIYNGTARTYFVLMGSLFIEVLSTDHEDFLIPDQVGIVTEANNADYTGHVSLQSLVVF